jgi:Raf kinase inhibitor-like YbhB/YbcL family protein
MEDPDAPKPKPVVHWLLFNVPADVTHLREGIPGAPALEEPKSAMQGANTRGATGYFGPRPPVNDPHHYHFQIFALDTTLALKPGAKRGTCSMQCADMCWRKGTWSASSRSLRAPEAREQGAFPAEVAEAIGGLLERALYQ